MPSACSTKSSQCNVIDWFAACVQDGPELDKEFGDAGDDAEVLDEKLWDGDDEQDDKGNADDGKDAADDGGLKKDTGAAVLFVFFFFRSSPLCVVFILRSL